MIHIPCPLYELQIRTIPRLQTPDGPHSYTPSIQQRYLNQARTGIQLPSPLDKRGDKSVDPGEEVGSLDKQAETSSEAFGARVTDLLGESLIGSSADISQSLDSADLGRQL